MNQPETVGTRKSKWGEGPVWWNNQLTYVDIEGHVVLQGDEEWDLGQRVGFALPCLSERWIFGGDDGLFFLDPESGRCVSIADPEEDLPDNRFNDAAISPDGRLFAGTISTTKQAGTAALYRLDPDLSCHKVLDGLTNSNGLAWSPDGGTCYHVDTPTRMIRRYAYQDGELSDGQDLIDTSAFVDASPDGMTVDADGNLWVAFCHGGCVLGLDPKSGSLLHRIEFPTIETTSLCFAGNDLYVTSGSKEGEELSGRLFVVRDVAQGIPQTAFKDLY